jgi:hypothetical protein
MLTTLSTLTKRTALALTLSSLSFTALATDGSDTASSNVLAGTTWQRCGWTLTTFHKGAEVSLYSVTSIKFKADGSFKQNLVKYASDSDCKNTMSLEAVRVLDKDALEPGEMMSGYFKVEKYPTSDELYALDLTVETPEKDGFYTTMRLRGAQFQMSERCANEDYVKEGLCAKVDGYSPETRANYLDKTIFEVFKFERVAI